MKFFSVFLSLCLHLIVILLLVHFTGVPQRRAEKEKLYMVSLVSLQEKKAKTVHIKRKPGKKTKSIPKEVTGKKEVVRKPVVEKEDVKKKEMALLEKVRERIYSKRIEEMREEEIEKKKSAMRERLQGEEEKQEKVSYESLLKSIIEKNWFLNKAFITRGNFKTVVEVIVSNSGDIIKTKVIKSSGDDYFDGTVINAIVRSHLPEVPMHLRENHCLRVELYFTLEEYEELHS